jgi:hypothetical protein
VRAVLRLLPGEGEVQGAVLDPRLPAQRPAGRRGDVAGRLRPHEPDRGGREADRRAGQEGRGLRVTSPSSLRDSRSPGQPSLDVPPAVRSGWSRPALLRVGEGGRPPPRPVALDGEAPPGEGPVEGGGADHRAARVDPGPAPARARRHGAIRRLGVGAQGRHPRQCRHAKSPSSAVGVRRRQSPA